MKIKKYEAPSLPEALAKIKQDIGEEAVILKTRFKRRRVKGQVGKNVEVTAAVDSTAADARSANTGCQRAQNCHAKIDSCSERINSRSKRACSTETRPSPARRCAKRRVSFWRISSANLGIAKQEINGGGTQSLFGQPIGIQIDIARQAWWKEGVPEKLAVELFVKTVDLEVWISMISGPPGMK